MNEEKKKLPVTLGDYVRLKERHEELKSLLKAYVHEHSMGCALDAVELLNEMKEWLEERE